MPQQQVKLGDHVSIKGDPLRDPDSDDNGNQGDQDKGGGQKFSQGYSRQQIWV
jgi:hypothetical protein